MNLEQLKKANSLQSEIEVLNKILDCSTERKKECSIAVKCTIHRENGRDDFFLPDEINKEVKSAISKIVSDRLCRLQDEFNSI